MDGRASSACSPTSIRSSVGPAASGSPGRRAPGKSTLVERLVTAYRQAGLRVAVVAVDPTSPFTGGALLGDRIRMESVALDHGVYIRSMGSRGSLGGLATTTREVCDLLDAAGFDRILVETVGVGQSELDVARMADSTVLVLVPESGDGIQTLKSGVMEIADLFVVNKADRAGRREAAAGDRGHARASGGATRSGTCRRITDGRTVRRSTVSGRGRRSDVRTTDRPTVRPSDRPTWAQPVVLTVAAKGDGVAELIEAPRSPPRVARARAGRSTRAAAGACSTGRGKSWTGPPAAGSGRRPGPTSGSPNGSMRSSRGG